MMPLNDRFDYRDRYDATVGYYPEFLFPAWFDAPNDVRRFLRELWDENAMRVPILNPTIAQRRRDTYARVVELLWGQGNTVGYRRCGYLGWTLTIGSLPTLERVLPYSRLPNDPMPKEVLAAVQDWLADPATVAGRNWEPLFPDVLQPTANDLYDEVRLLFWAFAHLLSTRQEAPQHLRDMIGYCYTGDALYQQASGITDLWQWLVVAAIPAAWCLRLPERVWRMPYPPDPADARKSAPS